MDISTPLRAALGPATRADRIAAGGSPPLRWLLDSPTFATSESELSIAVGEDPGGQPCVADLKRLPHLLVSGVRGSGKSTFLRAVITTLLCRCAPADLRMVLFARDGAFAACEGLPHLLAPPASDPEAAIAFLDWAHHEMCRRYGMVSAAGVHTIDAYNRASATPNDAGAAVVDSGPRPAKLPYLVAVFDDLAGLSGRWSDGVLQQAVELCRMSRAVGIHLVMASEDLAVNALPGLLLAAIPARHSFRQPRLVDSSIALGWRGPEELTEAGEALFSGPPTWAPVSLRTPWISQDALRRILIACRNRFDFGATRGVCL